MATEERGYIGALTAASMDSNASTDHRELVLKKLRPSKAYLAAIEQARLNPSKYFEVFVGNL